MSGTSLDYKLQAVAFSDLRGWEHDDPSHLFRGLLACQEYLRLGKGYRTGSLGLTSDDLLALIKLMEEVPGDARSARRFFETHCTPFLISRADGRRGFVTAFYEPEVDVSSEPDEVWAYPFYRRPPDLVDLDETNRPADMPADYAFGQKTGEAVLPYADRKDIDCGCLDGLGLEIAWAKSKVDVFFAHVQGAARLRFPDGNIKRITYAAKAGHPFSPIGKLLIDRGEIEPSKISMQAIREWLARHPERTDEVLWHNRSYIFFREADVSDPALGPIAAAKVPLIPGRSLAVDRNIHTFGFPFFIQAEALRHLDHGQPFGRSMLALDTGSAIIGPARGDIFTGSGYQAGDLAGTVRHDADFYLLMPKSAAVRYSG